MNLRIFAFVFSLGGCAEVDYLDVDKDGYAAPEDCDDHDAEVYPGATDDSVDTIDQDCDNFDGPDQDLDGYADADAGGMDCDDLDPTVNPGAEDSSLDGRDSDCDGEDG